jgi:hypothetical protein
MYVGRLKDMSKVVQWLFQKIMTKFTALSLLNKLLLTDLSKLVNLVISFFWVNFYFLGELRWILGEIFCSPGEMGEQMGEIFCSPISPSSPKLFTHHDGKSKHLVFL